MAKQINKCCKTCEFWGRDRAKDAAGRIRSDRPAPCLASMPIVPASFWDLWGSAPKELRWMAAGYGTDCEVHKQMRKGK